MPKIGIHDLAIYIPLPRLDLSILEQYRSTETPTLGRHLDRARRSTGQAAIRFPSSREDSATMAAEAGARLWEATRSIVARAPIRHLAVGTETGLDHSKPLSAWVQGMLAGAAIDLGTGFSSFQVQHACAGASLAMVSIAALLESARSGRHTGLVVASDVARYETSTTAEITQGAGAVAALLGSDPDLLELELGTMGLYSSDVDDFFRPLDSVTARVKGSYSMECYKTALGSAVRDYAASLGQTVREVLDGHDAFVLHAPFQRMPEDAMLALLKQELSLEAEAGRDYLRSKVFYEALEPIAAIGNCYTASVFLVLAGALDGLRQKHGEQMTDKRALIASYGSGNTMLVVSARVGDRAHDRVAAWHLAERLAVCQDVGWEEYSGWLAQDAPGAYQERTVNGSRFEYLGRRDDGYRLYGLTEPAAPEPRG